MHTFMIYLIIFALIAHKVFVLQFKTEIEIEISILYILDKF